MNCHNVNLQIKDKSPSVSVDKCSKVRIILNEANLNCDIVSSKATELNITYIKDGN